MKAAVGDRMVVAATNLGSPVRDGEIIEVHGAGGEAPYLVRWSDDGHESLFFPGPDSHIERAGGAERAPAAAPAGAAAASEPTGHVGHWRVDVYLYEDERATTAHAVLHTGATKELEARGAAHLSPYDADVPEIGDEVAAARALRRLADRLLGTASDDIAAIEGQPVHLRS